MRASLAAELEGLPIIVVFALLLGAVHVHGTAGVPCALHLHDLPLDPAAADPARRRASRSSSAPARSTSAFPSVIAFSGFVFAVLFKEYELGWLAVVAGLACGLLVGFVNGFLIAVIGIPSFIATLAPSSSGLAWRPCCRAASPTRCAVSRRARSGNDRRTAASPVDELWWCSKLSVQALWTALVVVLPLVRAQPPPLRRARSVHRRQQRRVARGRHRRRCARRSRSSR